MINPHALDEAVALLSSSRELNELLPSDVHRVRTAYFGALFWPLSSANGASPLVVYLGARSGLEALLMRLRSPATEILVVEPNPARRAVLGPLLSPSDAGMTRICGDVEEARRLVGEREISYLRVAHDEFEPAAAAALIGRGRCEHLCGSFRPGVDDPLNLYRHSRDRLARAFFWRDEASQAGFGSDGGPVEVEVSVVAPAYNAADGIDSCVASLIDQGLRKLEIILVDDGSQDDTGDRMDRWSERHPDRVRVIHKANGGCASARMTGLAAARGEFVGFIDADDRADPSMFEELYRAAILRGAEISQCSFAEVVSDGTVVQQEGTFAGDGPDGRSRVVVDLSHHLTLQPTIWRRIYRRDFIRGNDIRFPEHLRRFDDFPFQFEALARASRMAIIPDPYYMYVQHPEQSINVRDDRLFVFFEIFDWLWERVMPWADRPVEAQLLRAILASHAWAYSIIERRLKSEYRRRLRKQLSGRRVHLRRLDFLRIAPKARFPLLCAAVVRAGLRTPAPPPTTPSASESVAAAKPESAVARQRR